MRPRANTLSHVDASTIGMLANTSGNFNRSFMPSHGHHSSLNLMNGSGYTYRGANNGPLMGLPKLDTNGITADMSSGLRTAPPYGGFGAEYGMNVLGFGQSNGNTINPHALHMNGLHGLGIEQSGSPFQQIFTGPGSQPMNEEEINFDWMTQGFENQMTFANANEIAIEDSSPSAMSTNSPAGTNDLGIDMNGSFHQQLVGGANMWPQSVTAQNPMVASPQGMDFTASLAEMVSAPAGTISPKSLLGQGTAIFDMGFPTPPDLTTVEPAAMGYNYASFQLPLTREGGASTASTGSMDSSLRQSSITTMSSDLVNEHMRNVLIAGLSQSAGFGQRKYSQPLISSPLSPSSATRSKGFNAVTFPSTQDLQRYVSAYIRYFHPHLPFLHIPTLNFESPEYTSPLRVFPGHSTSYSQTSIAGGGSCLILSIAAIGALYEQEHNQSKDLFDCAKKLISNYLEERRKANMTKTQFAPRHSSEGEDTPLWLVQAMLLNVIYGHNCGDKTAADIASNHCAALVSLARGAELARPSQTYATSQGANVNSQGHSNAMTGASTNGWNSMVHEHDDLDWFEWKVMEERKRTLYAVFILSSMLVTAYNHAPALTNSEIRLDLPCDEELWAADSAQTWQALGGAAQAESKATTFAAALTHLLMSAQRQQKRRSNPSQGVAENELRPSTFGCLILVNALHNYIWETRQRHLGRQWTAAETEQMHAHIEPALRNWQAAWASNPSHSLERPNPFGAGPLSADSIPLLDLAYVRLFVNLGRSKEAFWQRDYDAMAEELAKGSDAVQGQEGDADSNQTDPSQAPANSQVDKMEADGPIDNQSENDMMQAQSSRREKHLRKAAFYAADSLAMSDELGLTFADHTSRELPMQSALCTFDCAQVLAEWVTTVQERVGKYVGLIGRDEIDMMQVPGILLLEDEDRKLLDKIDQVLTSAEQKVNSGADLNSSREGGYGSRILYLTAHLLDRAAVWPGK